ncbi:Winged helix-turn-helix DNA-binding domain containing protein [Trema orientale]|uniref:Winged helix-turn-helix DNA-binding domain containing protein n=1 Tax=Trema orientale TaxID=63057 RepID=A0A2P5C7U5_TREOI|nr:Winged helix-turn-helix DNA-binding domain containing protein [Trema orientale]
MDLDHSQDSTAIVDPPLSLNWSPSFRLIHPGKTGSIRRLMRILTHSGFFTATKVDQHDIQEEAYDLTPSSRLLPKDKVPNMSDSSLLD